MATVETMDATVIVTDFAEPVRPELCDGHLRMYLVAMGRERGHVAILVEPVERSEFPVACWGCDDVARGNVSKALNDKQRTMAYQTQHIRKLHVGEDEMFAAAGCPNCYRRVGLGRDTRGVGPGPMPF